MELSLYIPIARLENPREIPDNMTLDSFEIVEDGIASVWLLWGRAIVRNAKSSMHLTSPPNNVINVQSRS